MKLVAKKKYYYFFNILPKIDFIADFILNY